MIDAIYFPYTTISMPVLTALETCFETISLLQPSDFITGPELRQLSDQGRIRLCCAGTDDSESLQVILKAYKNWAALHEDDSGLRAAYQQALQGRPPLYDDSATSRIRADIQSQVRSGDRSEDRIDDPATKLLRARLFLSVAHQFDAQEAELDHELSTFDRQEQQLFEQLHGKSAGVHEKSSRAATPFGQQRLTHMIVERMATWSLLYAACAHRWQNEAVPVMISDSRSATDHLIGTVSDTVTLLNECPLPAGPPSGSQATEWRSHWQAGLETLATDPWPREPGVLLPPDHFGGAHSQWRLTVYLSPGLTPQAMLKRLHRDDQRLFEELKLTGPTRNTLVCLFDRSNEFIK